MIVLAGHCSVSGYLNPQRASTDILKLKSSYVRIPVGDERGRNEALSKKAVAGKLFRSVVQLARVSGGVCRTPCSYRSRGYKLAFERRSHSTGGELLRGVGRTNLCMGKWCSQLRVIL